MLSLRFCSLACELGALELLPIAHKFFRNHDTFKFLKKVKMKKIKNLWFAMALLFMSTLSCAQQKEFQLSTHILDITEGLPAENVTIKLEKMNTETKAWDYVSEKKTNESGRINEFLPSETNNKGIYKFTFYTKEYFSSKQVETFYPFIEVTFEIKGENHFHVPITLSAYGYSTYRGS